MSEDTKKTEEKAPVMHAIGVIGMTSDGRYHVSYTGYYPNPLSRFGASKFGEWVESSFNLNKLLKLMIPRLERGRSFYLDSIHKLESSKEISDATQTNSEITEPTSNNSDSN